MRRETRRTGVFTRRALLLMGGQVALLGGLGVRLYQVQVAEAARYRTLSDENRISARMIAPPRGRILDRFGVVVGGNKTNWRAVLVAEQTNDLDATLDAFSQILPLADHERARILREVHRHRRFIPVMVREFLTWDEMARIEVNAPDLPGHRGGCRHHAACTRSANNLPMWSATSRRRPRRTWPTTRCCRCPASASAAPGVEKYHDMALRGRAGVVQLEVNALGRVIRELDRAGGRARRGGRADHRCRRCSRRCSGHLGDESASAVVLDCRNGEVLAMATTPSFDPSLFNSGVPQAQWAEWTADKRAPLINKATHGLYAPGSTFKMAVAVAALEARTLSPTDRINCPGYLDLGNARFHCWRKGGHGTLDLRGGLKNSCDVFFYETARRTGIDRIAAMANRFGLGVELDIDLPSQRSRPDPDARVAHRPGPSVGDRRHYRQRHRPGLHPGDAVAARHLCGAGCHRAGDPAAPHPQAGRRGAAGGGRVGLAADAHRRAFVRSGARGHVGGGERAGGTAPQARLTDPRWQLAGKTGSAQVRRVSREQRENTNFDSSKLPWEFRPHALFVAFAPYDAPRYAVSVVVEHGNAGAQMAGPIARDIMTDTLQRDPANRTEPPPQQVAEKTE